MLWPPGPMVMMAGGLIAPGPSAASLRLATHPVPEGPFTLAGSVNELSESSTPCRNHMGMPRLLKLFPANALYWPADMHTNVMAASLSRLGTNELNVSVIVL